MIKVAGRDRTDAAIRAKKALEYELANAIRDHFDTNPLKRELNSMVYESIVCARCQDAFGKVWKKNKGTLKVINHYGGDPDAVENAAELGTMSAVHCGDVIRLFGEVAEENWFHDDARLNFQVGGKDYWDKKKKVDDILPKVGQQADPGTRVRLGTKHKLGAPDKSLHDRMKMYGATKEDLEKMRKVRFRSLEFRTPGERNQIGAGMKVWAPQDIDILYRIEITFGLRVGATISGTTTDTLYFLSVFGKVGMDPIFYLLPFATIAAPGHHSLIEVAMPLALSGLINYSIGLYHTLMPEGSTSGAAGAMWKTLLDYEAKDNNRLMLVFFSQREQPGGYWEFHTSPERILFSSMANADRPMMMQFRGMNKGYLNELDLERWVRQSRLRNARAPFA